MPQVTDLSDHNFLVKDGLNIYALSTGESKSLYGKRPLRLHIKSVTNPYLTAEERSRAHTSLASSAQAALKMFKDFEIKETRRTFMLASNQEKITAAHESTVRGIAKLVEPKTHDWAVTTMDDFKTRPGVEYSEVLSDPGPA